MSSKEERDAKKRALMEKVAGAVDDPEGATRA